MPTGIACDSDRNATLAEEEDFKRHLQPRRSVPNIVRLVVRYLPAA